MDDVLALARRRPPFVSVYLTADTATEDGRERLALEWKSAREELLRQGASPAGLDRVEALLAERVPPGVLAAVVDGDEQLYHRLLAEPPAQTALVHAGPLPRLGPLLAAATAALPHVVALVDRTGADIIAVVDGRREGLGEVVGDTETIRKVAAGGWSQRRYQQRAENTWERNAAGVAGEVAHVAREVGAEVILAAGDERALAFLREHLPADVAPRLHLTQHGGRAAGADEGPLWSDVHRLVATAGAKHTVQELEAFGELRDRHGAVADGPGQVFTALRRGIAASLLVHDDPADDRAAWFSPTAPTLVALEASTLTDLGVEPVPERLVDIAIWSAANSGAPVHLVPAHGPRTPLDGLGARLRAEVDLTADTTVPPASAAPG